MGVLAAYEYDAPQAPDFVWSEMMSYWHQTDQLNGTDVSGYRESISEADFRDLAYQASYGQPAPYDGIDTASWFRQDLTSTGAWLTDSPGNWNGEVHH